MHLRASEFERDDTGERACLDADRRGKVSDDGQASKQIQVLFLDESPAEHITPR